MKLAEDAQLIHTKVVYTPRHTAKSPDTAACHDPMSYMTGLQECVGKEVIWTWNGAHMDSNGRRE